MKGTAAKSGAVTRLVISHGRRQRWLWVAVAGKGRDMEVWRGKRSGRTCEGGGGVPMREGRGKGEREERKRKERKWGARRSGGCP